MHVSHACSFVHACPIHPHHPFNVYRGCLPQLQHNVRQQPAGEFEVPPGAIYGVDVRLANVDDGQWWRGMLFKEVRC